MSKANNNQTVCAVVVTYNRKQLLVECLEGILNQTRPVEGIYIIDNNSNDGTPQFLLEKGFINQLPPENLTEPWEHRNVIQNKRNGESVEIFYVRMHENTGGAGGFHEGVKRAYERGYNWLWLMDDDAEPMTDTLYKLLEVKGDVVVPLIIGKYSNIQNYHHKVISPILLIEKPAFPYKSTNDIDKIKDRIELDANAFVGPIIRRNVIEACGFPNPKLFIWGDDTEYTYRIKKRGFSIILTKKALILHKDNYSHNLKIPKNQYWKVYYGVRNRVYIAFKYGTIISIAFYILRPILSFLINKDYLLLKLKIKALKDSLSLIREG